MAVDSFDIEALNSNLRRCAAALERLADASERAANANEQALEKIEEIDSLGEPPAQFIEDAEPGPMGAEAVSDDTQPMDLKDLPKPNIVGKQPGPYGWNT